MATQSPKEKFPLAGKAQDGWSNEDEATATCFCGAVQMVFPTHGEGLINSFVCHCSDCHKITASMFASNFTALDTHTRFTRGKENLKTYAQAVTIASHNTMTNYFCDTCGTLMFRMSSGFPGQQIMRIGTIDDFSLMETKLRPRKEQFLKTRLEWLKGVDGAKKSEASMEKWQENDF